MNLNTVERPLSTIATECQEFELGEHNKIDCPDTIADSVWGQRVLEAAMGLLHAGKRTTDESSNRSALGALMRTGDGQLHFSVPLMCNGPMT